jgi:hypothetical protein
MSGGAAEEFATLLGLLKSATNEELMQAFRAKVKETHPDSGHGDAEQLVVLVAARDRFRRSIVEREQGTWADEWLVGPVVDGWITRAPGRSHDRASTAAQRWFTPPPSDQRPRPGFWATGNNPTRSQDPVSM